MLFAPERRAHFLYKGKMQRILTQTADGSATLFVPALDEHYHSVKGAGTESQHIFIEMGLRHALAGRREHEGALRVFEVGFGTGLNALLTLEETERSGVMVDYTAVELYPLTWDEVAPLGYSNHPLFRRCHEVAWGEPVRLTPTFSLQKLHADLLTLSLPEADVVYFDAFSPEKQPELWSESLFCRLRQALRPGAVLTTYCAKGEVRRRLQRAGFRVERLPGPPGGKREILRATAE